MAQPTHRTHRPLWPTGLLCAVLNLPAAHAGRTDTDWMAPAPRALQINAPGDLERLDSGPAHPLRAAAGPAAAHAAMLADMRIATQAEARALLQGSTLPGHADTSGAGAGGNTTTIAALLDRLSTTLPSASTRAAAARAGGTLAELDCALFTEWARMRRLAGSSDAPQPTGSGGLTGVMGQDVPIRCLDGLARAIPREAIQQSRAQAADPGHGPVVAVRQWQTAQAGFAAFDGWLTLAGAALGALLVLGSAWGLNAAMRRRARTGWR